MRENDIVQGVWRYFSFANWTWLDREDATRTRAGWPTWRKAVRPVGAVAWWLGAVVGFFTNESGNFVSIALLVVVVRCVAFGIFDGIGTRRARRQAVRGPWKVHTN